MKPCIYSLILILLYLNYFTVQAEKKITEKNYKNLILAEEHLPKSMINQEILMIREYYDRRLYHKSYELLQNLEKKVDDKKQLSHAYYALKAELLIKLNQSDMLIDSAMQLMIDKDPAFEYIENDRSPIFNNRYKSYNIYPNLKLGFGTTISRVSIQSKGELPVVYRSAEASNLQFVSPGNFVTTGITGFLTYYPLRHLGLKVDFTKNFTTDINSSFYLDDSHQVQITESMDSRIYAFSAIWNLASLNSSSSFVNNLSGSMGYQAFNIHKSQSKYELMDRSDEQVLTRYANTTETTEYRQQLVHHILLGIQYEPRNFIQNKRIRVIMGFQFAWGLTDFNETENRLENEELNHLYYYAEDRLRMRSIQFQLQLGYNAGYHKKKYK